MISRKRKIALEVALLTEVVLLLIAGFLMPAHAQGIFLKYSPVPGIQKSTGLTYFNTAAASADVIGLWSGCTGSNFLRGDGTCTVPAGTGVTSVGLTLPSWYTVTGSPVTSSGTLAVTATAGQTAKSFLATPTGTTGAISLRTIALGDLPTITVASGGTGVGTLTTHGVLLGQGTGNVTAVAAMAADTLLQGQGASADPAAVTVNNCGSSTTALSYSTSTHTFGCQTISVGGTGTVTSLTGGTGVTATPSTITTTGSFAVDQSFTPTWTGSQIFRGATPIKAQNTGGTVDNFKVCATNGNIITGNVACGSEPSTTNPGEILVSNSVNGGIQPFFGRNSSSGTSAVTYVEAANDTIGHEMFMGTTSTTYAGTIATGAASQADLDFFGAPNAKNICWISNGLARMCSGTDGAFTINHGSGTANDLTITGGVNNGIVETITNTTNNTAAYTRLLLLNSSSNNAILQLTAPSYGSAPYTNGPTGEQVNIGTNANIPISIGTSTTERIRIGGGGRVTINAASADNTFVVNGVAGAALYAATFTAPNTAGQSFGMNIDAGTNSSDFALRIQPANGAATNLLAVRGDGEVEMISLAQTSAAQTGSVCWGSARGQLTVDTTVACLTSARRFKEHIEGIDSGLSEVMKLRPVSYNLKPEYDPNHIGPQVGLIAEEVGAVEPRLMGKAPDGQATGVRYMQLTAVLVKAIQQQQHEIYFLWAALICSIGFTFYRTRHRG